MISRTGSGDFRATFSETDPRSISRMLLRPWEPMTIRAVSSCLATLRLSLNGTPTSIRVLTAMLFLRSLSAVLPISCSAPLYKLARPECQSSLFLKRVL